MVRLARAAAAIPTIRTAADPLDFVLWQPSRADEPAWRAPFGVGRPAGTSSARRWRCTSTAPRSTCTAAAPISSSRTTSARSRRARASPGKPFVTHWLHSAMVNYEGEKMSKSLGNLVFVDELLKTADPRAMRLALMRHHYRHGFEWYHTDLEEGTALLHRLLAAAARPTGPDPRPFAQRVRDAIDDDLDTPRARRARRSRERDPLRRRRPRRAHRAVRARAAARRRSRASDRRRAGRLVKTARPKPVVGSLDRHSSRSPNADSTIETS